MIKETTIIKKDTSENWDKAKNFIPKKGEIIIYTDLSSNNLKIGDGKTKINDLSFLINYEYILNNDILIIKEGK